MKRSTDKQDEASSLRGLRSAHEKFKKEMQGQPSATDDAGRGERQA